MRIWTIQLARHRLVQGTNIRLINITLGSGQREFAPDAALLGDYKQHRIDQNEYTRRYLALCKQRYLANPAPWIALLAEEDVALACYCRAFEFCHRYPLVDYVIGIAVDHQVSVEYCGEITV